VTDARRRARRALRAGLACAVFLAALAALAARAAAAGGTGDGTAAAPVRHVVIVGVSGLRWAEVTRAAAPALWRLARSGSVGDLVDYAQRPLACPADGWLTLNSGARAAAPLPCGAEPGVVPDGSGGARIPAMAGIIGYNRRFRENPDWGLLGGLASCATAVGPGAAAALAGPGGAVRGYLPVPRAVTAAVLARCPLTVIDLGTVASPRSAALARADAALARITARLPPDTRLIVTAPGAAPGGPPHLELIAVTGPGYGHGLLRSASTRQPGIVTLTDLTTTVAGWLGRPVPSYVVGARITGGRRGSLGSAVSGLIASDTAEQVWIATHDWFLALFALAVAVLLALPALPRRGQDPRRERRPRWWHASALVLTAVPAGTFLANLVPWRSLAAPAAWLYGSAAAMALLVAAAALTLARSGLAAPREPTRPLPGEYASALGIVCLITVAVLGTDVMTGSRLQLQVPFGLSLTEGGRYYGIGNGALGVYSVSAIAGAAWAGARRGLAWAAAIALFAVIASGWPGFGAKAGGTIAMVPCFGVLLLVLAGARLRWARVAVPAAVSGVALFAVFALASYFFPALGVSDLGAFAGALLHGHGGAVLERKAASNVSTLTASFLSPLIPVAAVAAAAALRYPSRLRLRLLERAFAAAPLLRVTAWLIWLVLVLGWLADDSGVFVPAVALPFAIALVTAMAASVSPGECQAAQYRGSAFAGPSVAGQALG
jgi:hypothetical protein